MRYLFRASSLPVLDLPRWTKRLVAISVDICLCVVSTWIAFYLRLSEFVDLERLMNSALISLLIAVSIFSITGLYRAIFRYSGWPAILAVASGNDLVRVDIRDNHHSHRGRWNPKNYRNNSAAGSIFLAFRLKAFRAILVGWILSISS